MVKYGLLGDAEFFAWLEENGPALADGDAEARAYAVRRSVEMKAEIVVRDETEQGDRALLNLGHTFCHALEAATGYSDRLLHGEGVAIGCALAFELSSRLGLCAQEETSRVRAHLAHMKMKRNLLDISGELPDGARSPGPDGAGQESHRRAAPVYPCPRDWSGFCDRGCSPRSGWPRCSRTRASDRRASASNAARIGGSWRVSW